MERSGIVPGRHELPKNCRAMSCSKPLSKATHSQFRYMPTGTNQVFTCANKWALGFKPRTFRSVNQTPLPADYPATKLSDLNSGISTADHIYITLMVFKKLWKSDKDVWHCLTSWSHTCLFWPPPYQYSLAQHRYLAMDKYSVVCSNMFLL